MNSSLDKRKTNEKEFAIKTGRFQVNNLMEMQKGQIKF